jgi:rifampicin phosphotransferase
MLDNRIIHVIFLPMALHLPLLFHFNQHLNEFAATASLACYRGLLGVLRRHSNLRFNLHLSGTLIHALQWLDPEPLQLVRDGLADGQFELLGSTYAQNVPYATDDGDNARQIELHRRVIHDTFGYTPVTFWNPERCWRQSLAPIIHSAGYRVTLIEDHILDAAGVSEPVVLATGNGQEQLAIVRDDERLKHLFNFAAWFGRSRQLRSYLAQRVNHPEAHRHWLVYAEDAEAMGLWGWAQGVVPQQTWYHLDRLLAELEGQPGLELVHLAAVPEPELEVTPIPDGCAAWMNASLRRSGAPYHEDGYADWFDFNRRAPKLVQYRALYGRIRQRLEELEPEPAAARALLAAAWHTYLTYQYEFGCIGIGGDHYRGWAGVRAAPVLARAAASAGSPRPFTLQEDVNSDGHDEILLSDGGQLVILSPFGGRLLYWFDLADGHQHAGNQLAVSRASYQGDAPLPVPQPRPNRWLPQSARPAPDLPGASLTPEAAPTRLGKFLPGWIWHDEPEPFTLLTRDLAEPGEYWPLPGQRRAFVDLIHLDDVAVDGEGVWLAFEVGERSAIFRRQLTTGVTLSKQVHLENGNVVVSYLLENKDTAAHTIQLEVISELCPDYATAVRHGRRALAFIRDEECPGVANSISGIGLTLCPSESGRPGYHEALLSLEVGLTFYRRLEPGANHSLTIRLIKAPVAATTGNILPFDQIGVADLPQVGGKGANLGEMAGAGFPIPPGFCLTTTAFRDFIAGCPTAAAIYDKLDSLAPDDLEGARRAGQEMRGALAQTAMPAAVETAVLRAWRQMGPQHAFAVRSSATAEDLPDASFAGQQDTFLNVRGEAALLEAVRGCWLSLFTDRAILYRARQGFDHRQVALSVVVQQMVLPDVSGILFTADPVSGQRSIVSIDAGYGLGEGLVAGLVDADLYQVDKRTWQLVTTQVGQKQVAIRPLPGGGTVPESVAEPDAGRPCLTEAQAIRLAQIGGRIEEHYGRPQDIEWAIAGGDIFILQARPITTLFPVPETAGPEAGLRVYFSFAAVQGVMEPITPLGRDVIRLMAAGISRLFGYERTADTQTIVAEAAERLWLDITPLVRHPVGRRLVYRALTAIEPGAAQALASVWHEADLQPARGRPVLAPVKGLLHFQRQVFVRLLQVLRRPEAMREQLLRQVEEFVRRQEQQIKQSRTPAERVAWCERLMCEGPLTVVPLLAPLIAVGLFSLNRLLRLGRRLPAAAPDPLVITRGLPHNVTTEMDLALWQTAVAIGADPASAEQFGSEGAAALARAYQDGHLPAAAQKAVAAFLAQYGMRGPGEIDFGRPRWRENPHSVLQSLQSYLKITDPALAPDAVFERSALEAETAVAQLAAVAQETRWGRLKAPLIRALARRVRLLAGAREMPKFTIIRLMGLARAALLQSGAELARRGVLRQADDLFFLHLAELKALAEGEERDWQAVVATRRQAAARERQRGQIPRLLLGDGRAFYEGVRAETAVADERTLTGSPVSPGVVEGIVRVVFDPHETQLAPGEILVCPGTDPAWTPLFLVAGGLVMEMGGLMTHGSVVAREYGIPAVVGVHEATSRLQSGQCVRVDGTAGRVDVIDAGELM